MAWAASDDDHPARGLAVPCYAELLVAGQDDPEDPRTFDVPTDFAEAVLLESGKPAPMIPRGGQFDGVGRIVRALQWHGIKAAARREPAAPDRIGEAARTVLEAMRLPVLMCH